MAKQVSDNAKGPLGFLATVKETVQERLSLGTILSEVGSEMARMNVQASAELASVLFNGGSAFVPYGRGQNPVEKDGVEVKKEEPEQERGGREM